MKTFFGVKPSVVLLCLSLLVCAGWHFVLFRLPTDTLTGSGDFQDGQYHLNEYAPPDSEWSENGTASYSAILRVDARDVTTWLARAVLPGEDWQTDWRSEDSHQYLVVRRDNDGRRVINIPLQPPFPDAALEYLGIASLATLVTLVAAVAISRQKSRPAVAVPLMLLASGSLLNLAWLTFGIPFSYIALRAPFLIQLTLHIFAVVLTTGVVAHLALTFPAPVAWYARRRRQVLFMIYGIYPAGLVMLGLLHIPLVEKFSALFQWEQQVTVTLKALAYIFWAAQYRRANVIQRGQMHWILLVTTAFDLVYITGVFSASSDLIRVQQWMSLLLPAGYMLAILPGRSLRLTLGPASGFIHGVANTLTLALFLCGFGLAAVLLTRQGREDMLPVVTMVLSAGFALTTVPLANLLREQFDSWFHGTRSAQRALLHQFTGRASAQITLSEVTQAFFEALDQGVQSETRALWLWNDEAQALQPVGTSGTLIPVDSDLYEHLLSLQEFTLSEQSAAWEALRLYYGVMVLHASRKLVGVCAIGTRSDGRSYPADGLRFFETLARSATLALRNAQLVDQLEDKVLALRQSYHQLISAQEDERRRLATELHDETLQQLAHVNLLAGGLQQYVEGAAETSLHELKSTLGSAEKGLREILRGVHPAVLTDLGLIPALMSWLPRSSEVRIELTSAGFEGQRLPDSTLELTLYRLCQESVNNALRHASARRIDVRLNWTDSTVVLEVADDGTGFEPAALASKYRAENGHFGLTNLRERVSALNGHLVIKSQPNQGTLIRAVLPVQNGISSAPGDNNDGQ